MRGGSRPGAGRKRIDPEIRAAEIKRRKEVTAEAQDIVASIVAPPRKAGQKSAVEIMREVSNALYAMAAKYQPRRDETGKEQGDESKFRAFASDAASVAGKLAPFEGPTYSSVRMTQSSIDLSKLSDQELALYAELSRKAADDSGDRRGDSSVIH